MFESATFKLTLVYMGILSLICFFFSYNWFTIATAELDRGLTSQERFLESRPRGLDQETINEIIEVAVDRYEEARKAIFSRIVFANILIVSAGTLGSYYLARRSLEPIEKAHEEQLRFTADASHELRTPIAAMKTEIEVALRDPKFSKKEATELLASNIEELGKLSDLSDALLQLARQDELVDMDFETVNLNAIITKAIDRVAKAAKNKHITIAYDATDVKVKAHFDSIVELLTVLLDNAVKYSPDKSTIRIAVSDIRSGVLVSVMDQGIGIRKTDQAHIFERFYRADNSRSSQNIKGHGLGLSIAKNIADIHDAQLRVESSGVGTGSTFQFRLSRG